MLIGSTLFSTYWAISSARANNLLEKQSVELQEQVTKSRQLETRAVEAEQQAIELARERQNEAAHARAISKFVLETMSDPAGSAAPVAVVSKYLSGSVQQFKNKEFGGADSPSANAIVIDAGELRFDVGPFAVDKNTRSFDELPESIKKAIKSKVSQATGGLLKGLSKIEAGPLNIIPPKTRDRQEIRLLTQILTQQELEFGPEDEFVGLTLLNIARIHGRLNEPLKGQLAVHKAMSILKGEQQLIQCRQLLEEFAAETK